MCEFRMICDAMRERLSSRIEAMVEARDVIRMERMCIGVHINAKIKKSPKKDDSRGGFEIYDKTTFRESKGEREAGM